MAVWRTWMRPVWLRLVRTPRIKELRTDLRLLRAYGTRHPECIRLTSSSNDIFVDESDDRGRKLIRGLGRGLQPSLRRIWHEAVVRLQPTIVLDVGVNYGEFLLAETYPSGTRLVGIEANARLERWISRTVATHPNRDQITMLYALASDSVEEQRSLYVTRGSSGTSSAVPRTQHDGVDELSVRAVSVDSLFAGRELRADMLLFKIDTEGYEPVVLRGMRDTIARCGTALGIIEFDTQQLAPLGVDLDAFLRELAESFTIYMLDRGGHPTRLDDPNVRRMRELTGSERIVTDLLLVSDSGLFERLKLR